MKKLHVITNDKVWFKKKKYNSNNDLENIMSCFSKDYKVELICRRSSKKLNFPINQKVKYCRIKNIREKELNIFMISITPFNLFSLLKLIFQGKKIKGFVYLRSDGFLEYKIKYSFFGYFFYYLMFWITKKNLKIISCSKNFTHVKVKSIVHPSELTSSWFKTNKDIKFVTDFLYVGRFKKEKGVIYLTKIFKEYLKDFKLRIVGTEKNLISEKYYSKNIEFLDTISNQNKLIDLYDKSKILILPSYTEGFPKVISESLARLRPIIIFEEIAHVVNDRKGIFICKRNKKSIKDTSNYILKNYKQIQKSICKNYFYTREGFKKELLKKTKNEFI